MTVAEVGDDVHAGVEARVAPDAEGRRPTAQLAYGGDRFARGLDGVQDALRMGPQLASRLRRGEAAADAREQLHAQLGLERTDLLADRRLGKVQGLRGRAEGAAIERCQEVLELLQVQGVAFRSCR